MVICCGFFSLWLGVSYLDVYVTRIPFKSDFSALFNGSFNRNADSWLVFFARAHVSKGNNGGFARLRGNISYFH